MCKQEQAHSNWKGAGPVYVRTPSTTMESVAEQVKTTSVKALYNGMITSLDIDNAPRNERMVRNKKYNDSKNECKATDKAYRVNFADEIQTLCSMVTNDYLVKSVTVNSSRVSHVVLCSERQLNEIKAFCFDKQCGSVLSFDKTYSLGSLYVTDGVYRNLVLQRIGSGNVPIFIGPIFIHGNSYFETYTHFFSYLFIRLASCDCRLLRLGSDEELLPRSSVSLLLGFSAMLSVSLVSQVTARSVHDDMLGVNSHLVSGPEISRLQHGLQLIMAHYTGSAKDIR